MLEALRFPRQLFLAFRREAIEARFAVVFGDPPLGRKPALDQHAIQGRVQRSILYLQPLFRSVADAFGDRVTMKRTRAKSPEDQEIKRAG